MVMLRIAGHVVRIKLALLAVLAIILLGMGVYLNTPRELPFLTPGIEKALSNLSEDYHLKASKITLQWAGWRTGLAMQMQHLNVYDKDNNAVLNLPNALLKLDTWLLLSGKVSLKSMILKDATMFIHAQQHPQFIGPNAPVEVLSSQPAMDATNANLFLAVISHILRETADKNVSPIQSIQLNNITVYLNNHDRADALFLDNAALDIVSVKNKLTTRLVVNGRYHELPFSVEGGGYAEPNENGMRMNMQLRDVSLALMAMAHPSIYWLFGLADVRVSGQADVLINRLGNIVTLDISLETATYDSKKKSDTPNTLATLPIKLTAALDIDYAREGGELVTKPTLTGSLKARDVPMELFAPFWPTSYEPYARNWITQRITGGWFSTLDADFNLRPEDFVNVDLREDAVKAKLVYENGQVFFDDRVAPLTQVKGVAEFNPNHLTVTTEHAQLKDTLSNNLSVTIDNLGDPEMLLTVKGDLQGPVQDLLHLAALTQEEGVPQKPLFDQQDAIAGTAETTLDATMPIGPQVTKFIPTVHMGGVFSSFSYPNALRGQPLTADKLDFALEENALHVRGAANIASVPLTLDYMRSEDNGKPVLRSGIQGEITPVQLGVLLDKPLDAELLKGPVMLDVKLHNTAGAESFSGVLDVTNAEMNVPMFGLHKKASQAGKLNIAGEHVAEGMKLQQISFVSPVLNLQGKGMLHNNKDKDLPQEVSLTLDSIRNANNQLQAELSYQEGRKMDIVIKGKQLDATPMIDYFQTHANVTESKQPFSAKIDVERTLAAGEEQLNDMSAQVRFDGNLWQQFDAKAEYDGGGKFTTSYGLPLQDVISSSSENALPNRIFHFYTDNAGSFIRAFDFYQHIRNGTLEISAETKDTAEDRVTRGTFVMNKYNVVKAPVLAQILTLASLGGILDTLQGDGIAFEEAKGEFLWRDDTLSILKMRSKGSAMGLTINGDIDMAQHTLDLGGAIVPAYFINNVLGSVPLVGKLLIGKEGEGLIASRYTVKGSTLEPDVSVNALSLLTPGFLRGIWGEKELPANIPDLREEPLHAE